MGDDALVVRQHDELRKFNYHGDAQYLAGRVTDTRRDGARCLVDLEVEMHNQRGDRTTRGEFTLALPSREHGPALFPAPPDDVAADAVRMMARHGELARPGAEPRQIQE